jgi:hypothetical protein
VETAKWDGSGTEGQGLKRAWPLGGLPLVARLDFRPGFGARLSVAAMSALIPIIAATGVRVALVELHRREVACGHRRASGRTHQLNIIGHGQCVSGVVFRGNDWFSHGKGLILSQAKGLLERNALSPGRPQLMYSTAAS